MFLYDAAARKFGREEAKSSFLTSPSSFQDGKRQAFALNFVNCTI